MDKKKMDRIMEDLHPIEFEIFKLIKRVDSLEQESRIMTGLLYHFLSNADIKPIVDDTGVYN